MSDRFISVAIKNGILLLCFASVLLPDIAAAGSTWDVNGHQVYVHKGERKAMNKALAEARQKALEPPPGGLPSAGGGMMPPCEAVLCLKHYVPPPNNAPPDGDGGPGCEPSKKLYFGIKVFVPYEGFSPELTSAARWLFLSFCPGLAGPNQAIAEAENYAVGELEDAPPY